MTLGRPPPSHSPHPVYPYLSSSVFLMSSYPLFALTLCQSVYRLILLSDRVNLVQSILRSSVRFLLSLRSSVQPCQCPSLNLLASFCPSFDLSTGPLLYLFALLSLHLSFSPLLCLFVLGALMLTLCHNEDD